MMTRILIYKARIPGFLYILIVESIVFVLWVFFQLPCSIQSSQDRDQIQSAVATQAIALATLDPYQTCIPELQNAADAVVPQWELETNSLFCFLFFWVVFCLFVFAF